MGKTFNSYLEKLPWWLCTATWELQLSVRAYRRKLSKDYISELTFVIRRSTSESKMLKEILISVLKCCWELMVYLGLTHYLCWFPHNRNSYQLQYKKTIWLCSTRTKILPKIVPCFLCIVWFPYVCITYRTPISWKCHVIVMLLIRRWSAFHIRFISLQKSTIVHFNSSIFYSLSKTSKIMLPQP